MQQSVIPHVGSSGLAARRTPAKESVTPSGVIVEVTTDYAKFKLDLINRPISEKHVAKMVRAIQRKNLLAENPILVSRDGTVIDGQHRLQAAKQLGLPVYYIISVAITIEDAGHMNGPVENWSKQDWLHHWVQLGNENYIKLAEFIQRHPWMYLSMAQELCTYGTRAESHQVFESGEYNFNDGDFAETVAQACLDFAQYISFHRHPVFIRAVGQLFEHAEYDHQRMMDRMQYMSRKLVKCPDAKTYLTLFEEIYNFRTRKEYRIRLELLGSNSKDRREDRRQRLVKEKFQSQDK